MELHQVLAIAMVGAASGFGLYCLSCALHVWRSRNKHRGRPGQQGHRATRWVRAIAAISFFGGMVCMALTAALELALSHEGLLHGEGLFTVRPPKDLVPLMQSASRGTDGVQYLNVAGNRPRFSLRQSPNAVAIGGARRLSALRTLLPLPSRSRTFGNKVLRAGEPHHM